MERQGRLRRQWVEKGTAQGQMMFWDATLEKWVHTEITEAFWDDVNKRPTFSALILSSASNQLRIVDSDGGQEWRIGANSDLFLIEDENTGFIPFRIEDGAPSGAVTIDSDGKFGIGTTDPQAELDLGGAGIFRLNNGAFNGQMKMDVEGNWEWRTLSGSGSDGFIFRGNSPQIVFRGGIDDSMGFDFKQGNTRRAQFQYQDTNNRLRFISSYGRINFNTDNAGDENTVRMAIDGTNGYVNIGGDEDAETLLELQNAVPHFTAHCTTHTNDDNSGLVKWIAKREDGVGTETESSVVSVSHDGAGVNDQLAKRVWGINTGSGVVDILEMDSIGALWFFSAGGLVFGGMHVASEFTVTIGDANPTEVAVTGTGDGWTAGDLKKVTFPTGGTEHYLTVPVAGIYEVTYSLSVHKDAGPATAIHVGIMENGVAQTGNGEAHTDLPATDISDCITGVGTVDCTAGTEEISLWVSNDQSNDVHIDHGTMLIKQIGGT